jgi:sec-independent protein translocase protein TatC
VKALTLRRRKTKFQLAAEGSMTLLDHLRELRSRLFKAALGIGAGFLIGWFLSTPAKDLIKRPYCDYVVSQGQHCTLLMLAPTDGLVLTMQIALWIGLIISAPIWLYQLWAFIAPGLHRNERRWAYAFVAVAAPLFAGGAVLAYFVVPHGLQFLLSFNSGAQTTLELTKYFGFVTGLMWMFGAAFEFPLIVVLFNLAGLASAKKLLGWWRIAVLLTFLFAGIALPTGDPFSMVAMGAALTALYFAAVLFAYFNDRRRARRHREQFGDVDDDQASPLDFDDLDPVTPGDRIESLAPVAAPLPLASRYDDVT